MAPCSICLTFLGQSTDHSANSCPIRASLFCRRCHCKGHTASQCEESDAFWERPTSLEELIPQDTKTRWHITSHTALVFENPRGSHKTDTEFQYEYILPNRKDAIAQFIEEHNIPVGKRENGKGKEDRIKSIRDWAMHRGYRIRLSS